MGLNYKHVSVPFSRRPFCSPWQRSALSQRADFSISKLNAENKQQRRRVKWELYEHLSKPAVRQSSETLTPAAV